MLGITCLMPSNYWLQIPDTGDDDQCQKLIFCQLFMLRGCGQVKALQNTADSIYR